MDPEDAAQMPGGVLTQGEARAIPGTKSAAFVGSCVIHAISVESRGYARLQTEFLAVSPEAYAAFVAHVAVK